RDLSFKLKLIVHVSNANIRFAATVLQFRFHPENGICEYPRTKSRYQGQIRIPVSYVNRRLGLSAPGVDYAASERTGGGTITEKSRQRRYHHFFQIKNAERNYAPTIKNLRLKPRDREMSS